MTKKPVVRSVGVPILRAVSTPTVLPISPTQAAHIANVSRRTIMRALEAKEIKAFRDNRNCWQIDPASLATWAKLPTPIGQEAAVPTLPTEQEADLPIMPALPNGQTVPMPTFAHAELVEIARLQERLAASELARMTAEAIWRERLTSVESDRDAWRALVRTQAPSPGWWQRWLKL